MSKVFWLVTLTTLRRRFSAGLLLNVSYTYGKAIDNMSGDPVGPATRRPPALQWSATICAWIAAVRTSTSTT